MNKKGKQTGFRRGEKHERSQLVSLSREMDYIAPPWIPSPAGSRRKRNPRKHISELVEEALEQFKNESKFHRRYRRDLSIKFN
jgi:hypothetical protein